MTFTTWNLNPLLTGLFFELGIIFLFQILVRRIWVHPGRTPKYSLNYQQGRLRALSFIYFGILGVYFEFATIHVGPNYAFVNVRMLLFMYVIFFIGQQTAYIILLAEFVARVIFSAGGQMDRSLIFLAFYAVVIYLLGFSRRRLWTSKALNIFITSAVAIPIFWLLVYAIHIPIGQRISLVQVSEQIIIFWILDIVLYTAIIFLDRDNRSYIQRVHQATIDELTGLSNYSAFTSSFSRVYKKSRDQTEPLILIAMDIDRFKRINDTFGHLGGNEVLTTVGDMLRKYAGTDKDISVYRVGGEEFEMMLTGMTMDTAEKIARELQTMAESEKVRYRRQDISFTLSFGIARLQTIDVKPDLLYDRADRMLYQSKGRGRNEITTD